MSANEKVNEKPSATSSATILSNFIIIVAGVVLCLMNSRPELVRTIVMIIGGAFTIAGIINLFIMINSKKRGNGNVWSRSVGWLSGLAGILIGAAMLLVPHIFSPVLVFFLGSILIIGGIAQICNLAWGYKPLTFHGSLYIIPVLLLIAGASMLASDTIQTSDRTVTMITAIGMILYGLNSYMTLVSVGVQRNVENKRVEVALNDDVNADSTETAIQSEPIASEPNDKLQDQ